MVHSGNWAATWAKYPFGKSAPPPRRFFVPNASSALSGFPPILLQQTGQAQQMGYSMINFRKRRSNDTLTRDKDDVPPWNDFGQTLVHRFAQESFDTIPHDSLANSTANRESKSRIVHVSW